MKWTAFLLLTAAALGASAPQALGDGPTPETLQGFERYLQASEVRIAKEETRLDSFLYLDTVSPAERAEALTTLKRGGVFITPLRTLDASGHEIEASDGLIHHWLGIVFIPGVSVGQVLSLVEDYDHHQDYYQPEVTRSRLLRRQGNDFKIFLRFHEKKIITINLDTEHDVRYTKVDANHWYSRTVATRIQQVEDAGKPGEHDLPVGGGDGYLWRMNTYWRFEERDGGVYVQCESISLTRDIPRGLGWMLEPFVTSIPKESLQDTLGDTRKAVLRKQ